MMLTWLRLLALGVALTLVACGESGPVDWTAKLEKSDRLSTIKGMLNETRSFDEQIELLEAKQAPSLNQTDALLALDLSPLSEDGDGHDAVEASFDKISELRAAYQAEFDLFVETKRRDKSHQEPESMKKAQSAVGAGVLAESKTILPFLQAKVKMKRESYIQSLVTKYSVEEPCRNFELVDALRMLGNGLIAVDDQFIGGPLYQKIVNEVLLNALVNDIQQPPLTALTAAGTLEKWQVKEHLGEYVKVIENEKLHFDLRDAMMKLLSSFDAKDLAAHKGTLMKVLNTAPELQPISYIAKAAKSLGEMGEDAAIDRLIECMWLDDARGRSATSECRLALNHLDPAKVGASALKTFKRQNKRVEERAVRLNYAHTGLIEAKAAELLSDVKANDSVPFLVMGLEREDVNPAPFAENPVKATFFTKGQVQKTVSIARSLAALGDVQGVKPLMKIIGDEQKLFEYKLAAAQQLAFLGSEAPLKDLIKIFNKKLEQYDVGNRDLKVQYGKTIALLISSKNRLFKGFKSSVTKSLEETQGWIKEIGEQVKQAQEQEKKLGEEVEKLKGEVKALKDKGVKMPKLPQREKVAKMEDKDAYKAKKEEASKKFEAEMKAYEEALTTDQKTLRDTEAKQESTSKAKTRVKNLIQETELRLRIIKTWEDGFKEIMSQLNVVAECGADQAKWSAKLAGQATPIRTLAAYTLAGKEMDGDRAAQALIQRLSAEQDAPAREVLLFGISRHAKKSHVDALKVAQKSFQDKLNSGVKDPSLKGTIYSLDLMIAGLSR